MPVASPRSDASSLSVASVPEDITPHELADKLRTAARDGAVRRLENLMPHVLQFDVLDEPDRHGFTALQWAAWEGHLEVAQLLLSSGAKVNVADSDLQTPLYNAALEGHGGIVSLLLRYNAAVDQADADGETPLAVAAARGYTKAVGALCGAGADPTRCDKLSRTPRRRALDEGHSLIVGMLGKYEQHWAMLAVAGRLQVRDGMDRFPTLTLDGDWATTNVAALKELVSSYWGVSPSTFALGDRTGRFTRQPSDNWRCTAVGVVTGCAYPPKPTGLPTAFA